MPRDMAIQVHRHGQSREVSRILLDKNIQGGGPAT